MDQIAEQITEDLIQNLAAKQKYYTLEDLLSSGTPRMVVETVRNSIENTVDSELKPPVSAWIQTDSERVEAAWDNFVEISKQHIKIPAAKLPDLLQQGVEQCLELALKPQQSVPEIIFKTKTEISFESVKERVSVLEVNRQLGLALVRYMEKKEKSEITIDQAREIIKKVDQKLAEDYDALDWNQALKPVFELAGPAVDPGLIKIFFEGKQKSAIGRKFGTIDNKISENDFLKIMSSAEMLDAEEYEEKQEQFIAPPEEEEIASNMFEEETDAEEELIFEDEEAEAEKEKDRQKNVEEDELEEEKQGEENIANLFSDMNERQSSDDFLSEWNDEEESSLSLVERPDEPENEDENVPLLHKFMFDEGDTENSTDEFAGEQEVEDDRSGEKEPLSIYEEMNLTQDTGFEEEESGDESNREESSEEFSFKIPAEEEDKSETLQVEPVQADEEKKEADTDEEETPMWRSFLERDDAEGESGYEYEEKSEEDFIDDEGFIEEPIYDLTAEEPDREEKISEISEWLDDERDRFVEEIFGNSEIAYEQAVLEIMNFKDWKSASNYLEKEVFSRNKINVYDEVAVDFTDRLHSYFMKNKS